jgi:hypothetical protein
MMIIITQYKYLKEDKPIRKGKMIALKAAETESS